MDCFSNFVDIPLKALSLFCENEMKSLSYIFNIFEM